MYANGCILHGSNYVEHDWTSRDGTRQVLQKAFSSEFQLVAMEANATTPLFIIILPSIEENKEEDSKTNPFEHLLAIDEQSLHFIITIDYNVWLSSSQVGHKN